MSDTPESSTFRLAYVPGVTPAKWVRTWAERLPDVPLELVTVEPVDAERVVRDGDVDVALLRLPVDRALFSAIPLYTETTVVLMPKDHDLTGAETVPPADLDDVTVLYPLDDTLEWETLPGRPAIERPATTVEAIELVAAGIGVLLVPQSLARLHHRKDLVYRPMADAAQSTVALAWLEGQSTDLVEEFIGIVRGRTVNSSRGRTPTPPAQRQSQPRPTSGRTASGRRQGTRPARPRRRK